MIFKYIGKKEGIFYGFGKVEPGKEYSTLDAGLISLCKKSSDFKEVDIREEYKNAKKLKHKRKKGVE